MGLKQMVANDNLAINAALVNVAAVNVGGIAATDQKPLFIVPSVGPSGAKGIQIDDIEIVSDVATTGSDDSNKYAFQVHDMLGDADLLATAIDTYSGDEMTGDTAYRITPDQNNTNLAAGTVIELQVTKTGSPTDLTNAEILVTVTWHWEVD